MHGSTEIYHRAEKKPLSGYHVERLIAGVVSLGMIIGIIVLYFIPPGRGSIYPPCLFHETTGLYCPGCGSTRAVYHLVHGDIPGAFASNPFTCFLLIPLSIFMLNRLRFALTGKTWRLPDVPAKYAWIFAIITLVFWILRNIPHYPFNLLAPH